MCVRVGNTDYVCLIYIYMHLFYLVHIYMHVYLVNFSERLL